MTSSSVTGVSAIAETHPALGAPLPIENPRHLMPLSGGLMHPHEWTLSRRTTSGKRQVVGRFQTLTDVQSHGKVMRRTGREPSVRRELGGQTLTIIEQNIRLLQRHRSKAVEAEDLALALDLNCQIDRLIFRAYDYAVAREGTLSVSHDESGAIALALVEPTPNPIGE